MKDLFPGFYPTTADEIDLTIPDTFVVFDANVLLNLYRYPTTASEDILRLMEGLNDKVWLPYHVALEYQRNRLAVIADQKKRFREVRAAVEKGVASMEGELGRLQLVKRHSTINITNLISDLHTAQEKFLKTLEERETAQRDVTDGDPTRVRLDAIFSNRVGKPPAQDWISRVEKEGKARYDTKCPPGYCDQAKEGEVFTHQGFPYKREFGDLFLWEQLMIHAREKKAKQIIFVTDDDKEDWWLIQESAGPKRLGPRPELIEELKRQSGVERFFMLNSERFAPLFAKLLKIKLRANTIEQVQDVRSTLSEVVTVACPSCRENAKIQLGGFTGSSAFHFCTTCKTRFHIHRGPDGNVFTREWGGGGSREPVQSTHRVLSVCPKCGESVPANIRDGEVSTQRYCMNCCSLITIDSTGRVLSSTPSSPVTGANVTSQGHLTFISCPQCSEVPPLRPIWRDGSVVRAVCPSCAHLIEGTQQSPAGGGTSVGH
jgi:hypothetical protein